VVACLTFLFTSCYILAHGYLLVILYWSRCEDSLLFYISFFSWIVFDEFSAKGGEIVYKVG
jgi:hypothetical protein